MARKRWGRNRTPAVDFARYNAVARRATVLANAYAIVGQHPEIGTEHLALSLATPTIRDHFDRFVPVVDDVEHLLGERGYGPGTVTGDDHRPFSPDTRAIIAATFAVADAEGRHEIGAEHLLFALLDRPDTFGARALLDLGVDPSRDPATWRRTPAPGSERGDAD